MKADRILVALATLRLTAKEVGELKKFVSAHSVTQMIRALHEIEDAVDDGNLTFSTETRSTSSGVEIEVENRIRQIFQNDLKISSNIFVHKMIDRAAFEGKTLPKFDSKKGFGSWVSNCLQIVPPSELLRLATIAGSLSAQDDRSWHLR